MRGFSRAAVIGAAAGVLCASTAVLATPLSYEFQFMHIGGGGPDVSSQLVVTAFAGSSHGRANMPNFTGGSATDDTMTIRFQNIGNIQSVISRIYFFDGTIVGESLSVWDGPAARFEKDANPSHLAGFSHPATHTFSADSSSPQPIANAIANMLTIGGGEWVEISFDLQPQLTWAHTYAALLSEELRVGLHIQDLPAGQSAQYISFIPLPSAGLMGLAGVFGVCGIRRRRN
jgi:MYXO-CTERM domain-containing protein